MDLEIWHEVTLSAGTAMAVLGFFRSLEQRKDGDFADLMTRLCHPNSPVMRAGAARQLPSLHRYRRYLVLHRPYESQALHLAVSALKTDGEPIFVRQALVEALQRMMPAASLRSGVRLDHSHLEQLTMMGFDFEGVELARASMHHSGLEGARFAGANLWRADLQHCNLQGADFTGAKLWETDLSHTNLEGARLVTDSLNDQTSLTSTRLDGAVLSTRLAEVCRRQGCDLRAARIQ